MVTVLVVDDQVLIRAGLAALIRTAPDLDVVGEASNIRMPGMDGITATERIVAHGGSKVLILTTFDVDEYVYRALRLGASGFLLKDTPPERLLAAIRTVASGDVLLAPSATRHLIESFSGPARTPAGADLGDLTARETEVLRLVGRGLSNRQIAHQLTVAEATVKTHLNRVLAKLGLSSRAQAVVLAYDCGLVKPGRR